MQLNNQNTNRLPSGFETLEPFVGTWGDIEAADERLKTRQQTAPNLLQAFYEKAAPMLEKIFTHLDQFPTETTLPAAELCLYRLALGIIEAGQFVEVYRGRVYGITFHSLEPIKEFRFEFTR